VVAIGGSVLLSAVLAVLRALGLWGAAEPARGSISGAAPVRRGRLVAALGLSGVSYRVRLSSSPKMTS
jgi:hypothetical protein